ncbi:MAG: radical SAM/SPASM domain-containing protein [Bacteroidales bacterium]|nr:radical SAM/SPASM domain-containing protein [Bacteroidales bacterium]
MNTLPAVYDVLNFISKLSPRKVWNYTMLAVSYRVSILTRIAMHAGMPFSISVEPTTSCNLRCPECPTGLRTLKRPHGNLDLLEFRNILEQLNSRLAYLMLYFQGEPMLNPQFFDLIALARKYRIYMATSTNAHYLDDERARKVVESGLDRLIISIDGTDSETYQLYRRGGDLGLVTGNIKSVMKWKKKLGSGTPYVILQFLVFRHNEHQIPQMKLLAKELGVDKLEFKSAQVYNYEEDKLYIPDIKRYSRYVRGADGRWKLKKPIRNRCFRMWSGAVITWDGRVVPCCFDKDAEFQLGNIEEQAFRTIWKGRTYKTFRRKILSNRSEIDICRNCTE